MIEKDERQNNLKMKYKCKERKSEFTAKGQKCSTFTEYYIYYVARVIFDNDISENFV